MAVNQSSVLDDFVLPLCGTDYRFHWGMGEVIEMQERLTTPTEVPTVFDMELGVRRGRLKYLRAMIVAGLRRHHPDVGEPKANELMQHATADEMQALLVKFGYAVTPDPKDVEALKTGTKKNPRKAQTKRTGATSTSAPGASV